MDKLQQRFKDRKITPQRQLQTVVLTGSTGALGNYILDCLLQTPETQKVYCLNRSEDAGERQRRGHTSRDLESNLISSKTQFEKVSLEKDHLGIDERLYRDIASTTTCIIHNAWPVDFNLDVTSFTPQLTGVKNLIRLTSDCEHDATLAFISSVSAVANWSRISGMQATVPEALIQDWRSPRMGYGRSKLISENLLQEAVQHSGIRATILRVGQLAGPLLHGQAGTWNRQEWVPSLLASSMFLKKVPATLGPVNEVDWVPMDLAAKIVVELLMDGPHEKSKGSKTAQIYHVTNPSRISWQKLLPTIKKRLGVEVQEVDLIEWVHQLRQSKESDLGKTDHNPAIKLLDAFFTNLEDKARRYPDTLSAPMSVQMSSKKSETLRNLTVVTPDWMDLWMTQLGYNRS